MFVREVDIHDRVMSLIDLLNSEPDPAVRLTLYAIAKRDALATLTEQRNATAYQARQKYALHDLCELLGDHHRNITRWVRQHRERTGAPPIPPRPRWQPSLVHDLSRLPKEAARRLQRSGSEGPRESEGLPGSE